MKTSTEQSKISKPSDNDQDLVTLGIRPQKINFDAKDSNVDRKAK
jgi:hypothetical protein